MVVIDEAAQARFSLSTHHTSYTHVYIYVCVSSCCFYYTHQTSYTHMYIDMCVSSCYIFLHHPFPLPPVSSHTLSHTPNTNPIKIPKSQQIKNRPWRPPAGSPCSRYPAPSWVRIYVCVCVFMCMCVCSCVCVGVAGGRGGSVYTYRLQPNQPPRLFPPLPPKKTKINTHHTTP